MPAKKCPLCRRPVAWWLIRNAGGEIIRKEPICMRCHVTGRIPNKDKDHAC
jgi:hypothetical protein